MSFIEDDASVGQPSLISLWESRCLCDVSLQTSNDANIPAHKVVLAAHSPFFRAIFAGASRDFFRENEDSLVTLPPSFEYKTIYALLKIIYSGGRVDEKNLKEVEDVKDVLCCANYFSMAHISKALCEYLEITLDVTNVVDRLLFADQYMFLDLYDASLRFLKRHFGLFLRQGDVGSLCHLTHVQLEEVLLAPDLCVDRGADVLAAIIVWISCSGEEREMRFMHDMLGKILPLPREDITAAVELSLPHGAEEQVEITKRRIVHMNENMSCHSSKMREDSNYLEDVNEIVDDAWKTIPSGIAGMKDDTLSTVADSWNLSRTHGCLLAAGGICNGWKSLKCTEIYDIRHDVWRVGPPMPIETAFATACSVDSPSLSHTRVYVTGHTSVPSSSCFFQYECDINEWNVLPSMTRRVNTASAALGDNVYVIGGRPAEGRSRHPDGVTECFCTSTQKWRKLSPLNHARSSLDACSLLGRIFAIGGQSLFQTHDSHEWYEPERDCWILSNARMSTCRKYATVQSSPCGRIIVIGGMDHSRKRLAEVEAYDPREGIWKSLSPLPVGRSSASACFAGIDDIYLVGGRILNDMGTPSVVKYSLRMDSWSSCAPMHQGRSSLAVSGF